MLLKALESYRSTTYHRIAAIGALLELIKAAPQLTNDHLRAVYCSGPQKITGALTSAATLREKGNQSLNKKNTLMMQSYPHRTKWLIMLLCTGLLQACTGSGKELPALLARKPAHSSEQEAKPIGTGSDEKVRQVLPLVGAQDDLQLKAHAHADGSSNTVDLIQTPASYVSAPVYPYQDHFKRLQKLIDRDIGYYLGDGTIVIPQLLKAGLRSDYQGQLGALQKEQDKQTAIEGMERLGKSVHFLVPDVCQSLLSFCEKAWRTPHGVVTTLGELVRVAPLAIDSETLCAAAERGDKCVRGAAISALAALAKAAPQLIPDVHKVLLQAVKDKNFREIRQDAANALVVLAKAAPQLAPGIFDALLKAMRDREEDSYGVVPEALEALMGFAPQVASDQVLETLIKATGNSNVPFYDTSIASAMEALAAAVPSAQNRDRLLKAAGSSHRYTHNVALRALVALITAAPTASHRDALLKAMKHADDPVRNTAACALAHLVDLAPHLANCATYNAFLQAAKDANVWIREYAESALMSLARTTPSAQHRDALIAAARNLNVCYTMVKALGVLVKVAPSLANLPVRDTLLKALEDKSSNIRRAAAEALYEFIIAAPHLAAHHLCQPLLKALATKDGPHNVNIVLMKLAGVTPSVQTRDILLEAVEHRAWTVRETAVMALEELIGAAPQLANAAVRNTLLQALADSSEEVHNAAASALATLVRFMPSAQNRAILLKAVVERCEEARYAIVDALKELIITSPPLASEQVCDIFLKLADDKHWRVRSAATNASGALVEVAPQYVSSLGKVLIKTAGDADRDVRRAAVKALGKLAKAAPQLGLDIYEVLRKSMIDPDKDVRCIVPTVIVDLLKGTPRLADKLLGVLVKLAGDPFGEVRSASTKALVALAHIAPTLIAKVHATLLQVLQDHRDDRYAIARSAAASALGNLARHASPSLALDTRAMLFKAMEERNRHIFSAVASGLVELAKVTPQLAGWQLCAALLNAAGDRDEFIRCNATNALEKLIQQTPPVQHRDTLLKASSGKSTAICYAVVRTLQRLIETAPSMANSAVLDAILRAMDDDAHYIRLVAVNALGALISGVPALIDSEVRDVLINATGDAQWDVHLAAITVLEELFKAAPTANNCRALVKATAHDCWRIRMVAASTLGKTAIPPAVSSVAYQALTKMMVNETEYEHVRDAASMALQMARRAIVPPHAE